MALLPVVALWALCPLLTRAAQPPVPVTVTAAIGEDACLPCGTQPWAELRGVTLSCSQQAGGHQAVPVLSHRLGWQPPPPEPGWQPPVQPDSRFRGRVAFCAAGTGDSGVSLLLRNLSQPDFGNYSCYASRAAAPQLLCSLVLQPAAAGVPEAGPDMLMVICVLTAAFTAVAIGVMVCARCQGHCWGRTARGPAQEPGAVAGAEEESQHLRPPPTVTGPGVTPEQERPQLPQTGGTGLGRCSGAGVQVCGGVHDGLGWGALLRPPGMGRGQLRVPSPSRGHPNPGVPWLEGDKC